jgi:UDP-N-acetylglucosamine 1-carboxyvinyltransferase
MKKITDNIQIIGGKKLSGKVKTNPSKNGALALIATALLNKGKTTLHNIPKNEEVLRLLEVIVSLDVNVKWIKSKDKNTSDALEIKRPEKLNLEELNKETFARIRVGLYLIPILLHERNAFTLPNPGGCKMGLRTISAHRFALENFGVNIKSKEYEYEVKLKNQKQNNDSQREIVMYESSDMGAINAMLMAALTLGSTRILFAPPNYQVQDVCFALEAMGVSINGVGTTTLELRGVSEINLDINLYNSEDPIESMLFISCAAVTRSTLTVERCPIDFLKLELLKLSKMGLKHKLSPIYKSDNGRTDLCDITLSPSKFTALPDKIHPSAYPGLNVDNLPFFVPIAALAHGESLVHDWMWENRAIYFTELNKLGANVKLADPHRVFITGVDKFKSAKVICPPALRPASIILVAMLAAEGVSELHSMYSINRGYEDLIARLCSIGADIKYM